MSPGGRPWYRGEGNPDQENVSQMDQDMLVMLLDGYQKGEIRESPVSNFGHGTAIVLNSEEGEPFATEPDCLFSVTNVTVYYDGPHHEKTIHADRDRKITQLLEESGWTVLRFPYRRNTKRVRIGFYNEIRKLVNEKWERIHKL